MSHDATNWAIKQRGLKPTTKLVLWHLADRHNPDYGCFPRQDTLCDDVEISRASLNSHLAILEDRRLIRRISRIDPKTKRQKSTRYILACEPDFAQGDADPCPDSGHGTDAEHSEGNCEYPDDPCPNSGHGAVSRKSPEPCPENGKSRVQNLDTNPVREPLREPVRRAAAHKAGRGANSVDRRSPENPLLGEAERVESFNQFWDIFPNPVERDAARKAFDAVLAAGEADAEHLTTAARAYARSPQVECGFTMKPANWLARGSWRDHAGAEESKLTRDATAELDAVALGWVKPVREGWSYAASGVRPSVARHMLAQGMVTEAELRRAGVKL